LFFGSETGVGEGADGVLSDEFSLFGGGELLCAACGEFNKDCKNWNNPNGSIEKKPPKYKNS
jgi:hypothetical protein